MSIPKRHFHQALSLFALLPLLSAAAVAQSDVQTAARPPVEVSPAIELATGAYPNDVLRFSTRFLEPVLKPFVNEINKTSPTRDHVLESFSVGTAHTVGRSWIEVFPNDKAATFLFHLSGQIHGRANAYRDPVRFSTRTTSQIYVGKWIQIGANGAVPYPAKGYCRTRVQYLDCQTDIKGLVRKSLVTKMGMKKAGKQRTAAEAVVARKFEQRFEAEVNDQIDSQLAELSSYYIDYHTEPLKAFGVYPQISSASTKQGVELKFRNMWREIKGAPSSPPAVKPHDFCGLVHESAISVLGGAYISNQVWQDSDFESVLKEMTGEVPRDVRAGSHAVRWSVRFADQHPLVCRFLDNNLLEMTNRISEYTVGETTTHEPLKVQVRYQLKPTIWGPEFNRQGAVQYEFASGERAAESEQGTFIKTKIDALWREQIYLDGIVPPAGGSWDQFRKLDVAELWIRGGWFAFGFDLRNAK